LRPELRAEYSAHEGPVIVRQMEHAAFMAQALAPLSRRLLRQSVSDFLHLTPGI
jgi:hypothetical protein